METLMDKNNFEKFDLLPMSFSKLNSFRNYPCQFILSKMYKMETGTSPAMVCGIVVEKALHQKLLGEDVGIEDYVGEYLQMLEEGEYTDQKNIEKYQGLLPKYFSQAVNLLTKNYQYFSYQEKINTDILGIPFVGYCDFIFELDDELILFDLKTKGRMQINRSDKIQQLIYKKALEEKYNKKVSCNLYIITPTKHHFEEIEFVDEHYVEINNALKGMNKVLSMCDTPEDMALIYQPNVDGWEWNNVNIPLRKEVWGV